MTKVVQENIRRIRKSMKITLRELSEKTGIDKASLSRMERNLQPLKLEHLEKIAEALNLEVVRFWDEE
jgi:transcriptional regulator with XRE-family HTH domain